jgi:ATP-dependent DNA helicase RecQ
MYGGIFETPTSIRIESIASKTGQSVNTIIKALEKMEKEGVLELTLFHTDATITFIVPREDKKTINRVSKQLLALNHKKENEVKSVLEFVANDTTCKSVQLLKYFGELNAENCGICSVCAPQEKIPSKAELSIIAEKIVHLLEEKEMTSRFMTEKLTFTESKVVFVLRKLMDSGTIKINTKNEYYLN